MDGLGYPNEFFEQCIQNGMQACAITEHGSCNSYSHAQLWTEDYNKKNPDKTFKYLPGIEGYFHPDLVQWKLDKERRDSGDIDKDSKKPSKKTKEVSVENADDGEEIESSNQLVVENEEESKSFKKFNPLNRRHHLIVLPKNENGLQKMFALVSRSYLKSFYRFPRFDTSDLREAAGENRDIVVTSACLHPDSLLVTNFGVLRIEDVVTRLNCGDDVLVLSWDDKQKIPCFKSVTWGACTRKNAKLFKVRLTNGKTLKLTGDHKVFTKRGYIQVCELTKQDQILSIPQ